MCRHLASINTVRQFWRSRDLQMYPASAGGCEVLSALGTPQAKGQLGLECFAPKPATVLVRTPGRAPAGRGVLARMP